jgi:hypothetical protein
LKSLPGLAHAIKALSIEKIKETLKIRATGFAVIDGFERFRPQCVQDYGTRGGWCKNRGAYGTSEARPGLMRAGPLTLDKGYI